MIRCAYIRASLLALPVLAFAACQDEDIDPAGPSMESETVAYAPGGKGKGNNAVGGGAGARIAFAVLGVNGQIHTMNEDGSGYAALAGTEGGTDPVWSPDRKKIAYAVNSGANAGLWVIGSTGKNRTRMYSGTVGAPAWSPDGSKIAFHAAITGGTHILVIDSNGTNLQQATAVGSVNKFPTWSADGSRLVYYSNRSQGSGLWIMNANGTSRSLLKACYTCVSPTWSPIPGDDRIAYVSYTDGSVPTAEIRIITGAGAEGPGIAFSYSHGTTDLQPSWSPDATRIAFTSLMLGGYRDLYTVKTDGTDVQRILATPAIEVAPAWGS